MRKLVSFHFAKSSICIILIVLLAFLSVVSIAEGWWTSEKCPPWSTMRNFSCKMLDGTTFDLNKTLKEKDLVVIDLCYRDCYSCTETSAALEWIYKKYEDRVAFIQINPIDDIETITLDREARGTTLPCAKFAGGKRWTDGYPHIIIIDKDRTVLYSDGIGQPRAPERVEALLDACLIPLTKEEKKEKKNSQPWGVTYEESNVPSYTQEEKDAYSAFFSSYCKPYSLKHDISVKSITMDDGEITKIVIDENRDIIESSELIREIYIAYPQDPFKVKIKVGKGFDPNKAHLIGGLYADYEVVRGINKDSWEEYYEVSFNNASKAGSDYVIEVDSRVNQEVYYFFESSDGSLLDVSESRIGFIVFTDANQVEHYFTQCSKVYGCSFKWHGEVNGKTAFSGESGN